MRTQAEAARRGKSPAERVKKRRSSDALLSEIKAWIDEAKGEEVVTIDLAGKSSIGDYMVIASGRSERHVSAIAEQVQRKLKDLGFGRVRVEGLEAGNWVLIDTGDIIVHVFRPEVREFYNLEKMWSEERPVEASSH